MAGHRIERMFLVFLCLCFVSVMCLLAEPETLAIKAKKIYTVTAGIIEDGVIIVEDGKILKVGKNLSIPEGAKEIKAEVIIPGLVDMHSHVGLWSAPVVEENSDGNEATDPVTPQVRALDGFNFDDPAIRAAREAGVTTIISRPGSLNVIGGTSVAIKMKNAPASEMVLKEECDLKMAIEGNPSGYYAELKRMPSTLMAIYTVARKAFTEAQEYQTSWEKYEKDKKAGRPVIPPKRDLGKETLVRVLKREIPVHIHCYTASEIMTCIRLADEFGFRLSLGHCDKSYLIVDELAKRKDVYYNVGPAVFDTYYQNALEFANVPAILAAAGLKVSLQTDAGTEQQNLRQFASLCVRYGMKEEDALKAITINAAEAVDLADRIGSIEVGKDADLVLLDGEPFEFLTSVEKVIIDGRLEYEKQAGTGSMTCRPFPPSATRPLTISKEAVAASKLAIAGGTVYTMAGQPIDNGVILVRDGKIEKVGVNLTVPDGYAVVDARGFVIMPGLVAARSNLGLTSNFRMQTSIDEVSTPVVPEIEVKHAIEPQDVHFQLAHESGLTSALITPGDLNVIGGQGMAVKTWGQVVDQIIIKDRAVMVFGLGSKAKRKQQMPSTRMGVAALLRQTLTKAQEYKDSWETYEKNKKRTPPTRDLSLEALVPVIKGEMPVIIHAERKDDILTALRIADDFKLKIVLDGATDAYKLVNEIKARGIPVILEDIMRGAGNIEDKDFNNLNPAILAKAGIPVAFRPKEGLWYWPAAGLTGGDLLEIAAYACRFGMPEEAALKAVTIEAAKIAGISDRVGSIEPGKDADLVILGGHPLKTASVPEAVFIEGKMVYQKRPGAHLGHFPRQVGVE
ncbi:MAG TPA: amidohydrolase family protein [Candidatus Saccharicenans sp.]|nr:amidohydrolase family protein [Candidatus Saccharicenans sp.]